MTPSQSERSYRLEPLDTSGIFLGLGPIQCALIGAGILSAVTALTADWPLPIAAGPLLTSVAAAFGRAGGRPLWAWIPLLAVWAVGTVRGDRCWCAPLPLWPSTDHGAPMPPCLDGLDLVAVDWRASLRLGAVRDRHRHTLTAVVPVTGAQFIVEPRAEQERLLAGWGDVMAQFAVERGVVTHLAWSDLARPSGLHHHQTWITGQSRGITSAEAVDSYQELLATGTAAAIAHEVVVTITVARDRLTRRRDPDHSDEHLQRALGTSVDALLRGLRTAGLAAGDPLDQPGLQRLLRTRIDPTGTLRPPTTGTLLDRLAAVGPATAGPVAVEAHWDHLRIDGAYHRTWWIGTWPRLAVPPSWLEPFLAGAGITRTMTVVLVPVPTHQSRRRIERDLVKLDSDATTKADQGRRIDARHRRATDALLQRDEELVAGYPEIAYAGLVTVAAGDLDTLTEHGDILEQLARENGMDLRALDARHDKAWAATLPFGLAPSTVLAS